VATKQDSCNGEEVLAADFFERKKHRTQNNNQVEQNELCLELIADSASIFFREFCCRRINEQ